MTLRRRRSIVVVLVLGMLFTGPAAFADELSEHLDRSSQAEFEGVQWIVCRTPDGTVSEVADVIQADGVVAVSATTDDRTWFARRGEYGSQSTLVRVQAAATLTLSDQYEVRRTNDAVELRRAVSVFQVVQDDLVRLDYRFDQGTGALLRTESFNADGSSYCTTSYFSFRPGAEAPLVSLPEETVEMVAGAVLIDALPESLAGFARVDSYAGTGGTTGAYYSDGLFSFLLVWADRPVVIEGIDENNTVELDRGAYQRSYFPGEAVYVWETPDGGYALLGDLPIDLQLAVLDELPRPGKPGFFARLWRAFTR